MIKAIALACLGIISSKFVFDKIHNPLLTNSQQKRMYSSYVQEQVSVAPDSSDPDPIRGERAVFDPGNPVELPVFGFTYGHRLRVVLETEKKSSGTFSINLKSGNDIILHFNPRMKTQTLVFNSFYDGAWETEEQADVIFPFQPGRIYTVEFVASGRNTVFVYVNGQLLYEFHERQSGTHIASVNVGGDISIHSVHVI